jgi:hypothetical protein
MSGYFISPKRPITRPDLLERTPPRTKCQCAYCSLVTPEQQRLPELTCHRPAPLGRSSPFARVFGEGDVLVSERALQTLVVTNPPPAGSDCAGGTRGSRPTHSSPISVHRITRTAQKVSHSLILPDIMQRARLCHTILSCLVQQFHFPGLCTLESHLLRTMT